MGVGVWLFARPSVRAHSCGQKLGRRYIGAREPLIRFNWTFFCLTRPRELDWRWHSCKLTPTQLLVCDSVWRLSAASGTPGAPLIGP